MSIFGQGSFINDPNATPEQVAQRRKAISDIMAGRYGSARTPAEGWMHLATGIMSGIGDIKLSKMEQDRRAKTDELFAEKMGAWNPFSGGTISTSGTQTHGADGAFGDSYAARNSAMAANGGPTQAAADQLNNRDRELLAKTLMAEAGGEGLEGMLAAGAVINNRVNAGGYGDGLEGVIMKPGQFSAWNGVTGYAGGEGALDMENMKPNALAFQAADTLLSGQYDDPTGGATHYYNPAAADPAWGAKAGGDWTRIGNHVFGSADAGRGTGPGTISTQSRASSMPAYTGPSVQDLAQLSANPWLTPEQRSAVNVMMKQAQQATDPLRQLQLQTAQLELERARNPQTVRTLSTEEATAMGLPAGGVYQMGADGKISTAAAAPKPGAGGVEYGLTPQYGVDAEGNPVLIQLGKNGTAVETPLPEGVTFQKEPVRIDAGTEIILLDPITRQPVGSIPKNNREAAAETAAGSAEGKAEVEKEQAAPAAIAKSESGIALINSIISDPNLDSITGMIQGRLPPMTQAGVDLNTKIGQLKGKAFLEAFESLKGGGQITEREGAAAQEAMARLDRAQSTPAYIEALTELRTIMETALARAQGNSTAADAAAQAGAATRLRYNPETGELE